VCISISPLSYSVAPLNFKGREHTFHFKTKERELKKVDIMHMRRRSRFQINVYWSKPVPNINAILSTASACRSEDSYSITCVEVGRKGGDGKV
jgi:hypothetical protein